MYYVYHTVNVCSLVGVRQLPDHCAVVVIIASVLVVEVVGCINAACKYTEVETKEHQKFHIPKHKYLDLLMSFYLKAAVPFSFPTLMPVCGSILSHCFIPSVVTSWKIFVNKVQQIFCFRNVVKYLKKLLLHSRGLLETFFLRSRSPSLCQSYTTALLLFCFGEHSFQQTLLTEV